MAVAPAVFIGDPPPKDDQAKSGGGGGRGGGSGGLRLPLDRALRFAWFRFLLTQDGPGINLVRGSVNRQTAAIQDGTMVRGGSSQARGLLTIMCTTKHSVQMNVVME